MKISEEDYEQEKEIIRNNLRICIVLLIILFVSCWLAGCAPKAYPVRVTYQDGSSDCFELNYKPKPNANTIDYDGTTILGIERVEIIK